MSARITRDDGRALRYQGASCVCPDAFHSLDVNSYILNMELVNLLVFISNLFVVRKNVFAFFFLIFMFGFCYLRYLISFLNDNYSLGGKEWIFPGVGDAAISLYSHLFFVVQVLFFIVFFFVGKSIEKKYFIDRGKAQFSYEVKYQSAFYLLAFIVFFISLYKYGRVAYEVFNNGYLAGVDMYTPLWISILTSSFVKPICLLFIYLGMKGWVNKYNLLFFMFASLLALTLQRKDIFTLLFFFFMCHLSFSYNKYIKLFLVFVFLMVISIVMFWLREDGYHFPSDIVMDIAWAGGISVNPGLYMIENIKHFNPIDSLGFMNTYYQCGIGRFFSDVCFSGDRVNQAGFILEKLSNHLLGGEADSNIGLGGNIVGSLYVASQLSGISLINLVCYILIGIMLVIYYCFVFFRYPLSITAGLFVCQSVLSARYAFDGLIPPLNQLIVSLSLDLFFLKRSYHLQ